MHFFQSPVEGAFAVALGDRLLLVIGVLAPAKRDFHLDERVFEVNFNGDERIAALVDLADDLVDLNFVKQEFSLPPRVARGKSGP